MVIVSDWIQLNRCHQWMKQYHRTLSSSCWRGYLPPSCAQVPGVCRDVVVWTSLYKLLWSPHRWPQKDEQKVITSGEEYPIVVAIPLWRRWGSCRSRLRWSHRWTHFRTYCDQKLINFWFCKLIKSPINSFVVNAVNVLWIANCYFKRLLIEIQLKSVSDPALRTSITSQSSSQSSSESTSESEPCICWSPGPVQSSPGSRTT